MVKNENQKQEADGIGLYEMNENSLRLFVPIDFTESSYNALGYALQLAKMTGGMLELFYAIDTDDLPDSENPATILQVFNSLESKAKQKLNSIKEIILENGVKVKSTYSGVGSFERLTETELTRTNPDIVVAGVEAMGRRLLPLLRKRGNIVALMVPATFNPSIPSKFVLVSDGQPVNERTFAPLHTLITRSSKQLTILEAEELRLKKLLLKYFFGHGAMDKWLMREFQVTKFSTESVEGFIKTNQPDIICKVLRRQTWLNKWLGFVRNSEISIQLERPILYLIE